MSILSKIGGGGGNSEEAIILHNEDTTAHADIREELENHTHTADEVGAATASHTHTASEVGAAASGHTHDDRYYTESEVDTKLGGKANSYHTHTKSQITDFPTSMTPTAHSHGAGDITSGTMAVGRGGTGITSNPSLLVNLASTSAASVFAASPRPGVTGTLPVKNGGTGVTSLDALATALGAAKWEVKSYVGTGTYGSTSPCSVTFSFAPKFVMFFGKGWTSSANPAGTGFPSSIGYHGTVGNYSILISADMLTSYIQHQGMCFGNSMAYAYAKKSSDGKTFSWYCTDAARSQNNESSYIYYYLGIG